ncbi:MAG: ComEC/Rec2 family competence protein [Acidimicrobiales bacterium]
MLSACDRSLDRPLSDPTIVLLALAAAVGARVALAVPLVVAASIVVVAVLVRQPAILVVGTALLASMLSARAWAGLAHPVTGSVAGRATLVTDPEPTDRGVRVEVRLGHHRYEAVAFGSSAGVLRHRSAGEVIELSGVARAASPDDRLWLAPRHIGAELHVDAVGAWSTGSPAAWMANGLRRTLDRGASVLSADHRALFAGFVLGDDREQSAQVTDDFRASGLSHLLVVSGQNVAFVLAVAWPLVRRFGLCGRFVTTVGLIGFFAMVTRFEPSVLRASAMAGLAALAAAIGREASGLRMLGLAVTGLILVDPLLVHSLGFGLSVGASAGILVIGPAITRALPGPRWLATATGVTVGAQAGVAPLLIPAFGGIPMASLPANLAAAPAAGPLVAWGMTGGIAAGVLQPIVGDAVPRLIHAPTAALVAWIAAVARTAARLPLGEAGSFEVGVIAIGLGALLLRLAVPTTRPLSWLARRARSPLVAAGAVGLMIAVTAQVVHGAVRPPPGRSAPADGADLWMIGPGGRALLVLDGNVRAPPLLEGLRRTGVRRLDLLVLTVDTNRRTVYDAVTTVASRYRPSLIVAPTRMASTVPGASAAVTGAAYRVGDVVLVVRSVTSDGIEVDVRQVARGPPAGAPPNARSGVERRVGGGRRALTRPCGRWAAVVRS